MGWFLQIGQRSILTQQTAPVRLLAVVAAVQVLALHFDSALSVEEQRYRAQAV